MLDFAAALVLTSFPNAITPTHSCSPAVSFTADRGTAPLLLRATSSNETILPSDSTGLVIEGDGPQYSLRCCGGAEEGIVTVVVALSDAAGARVTRSFTVRITGACCDSCLRCS
jgi:hypothetical protein